MDDTSVREQRVLSVRELAARITELAGHLNAAHYQWLSLIAEFDRREGWSDSSTQSCAHWLNWQCGMDLGAAREMCVWRTPWRSSRGSLRRWRAGR